MLSVLSTWTQGNQMSVYDHSVSDLISPPLPEAASHHLHGLSKQPVMRSLHAPQHTLHTHKQHLLSCIMQNKHINQHIPSIEEYTLKSQRQRKKEMKEAAVVGRSSSGGGGGGGRSESDKERTKLRERQRRAITTKIFHGLRKWGGYHLSPRADINEVLRQLAKEAGWIVESDGTTYRARLPMNPCPVCGGATPTTSSSIVMGGGGGGGDCSTTASPRCVSLGGDPNINNITAASTSTAATTPSSFPYFPADIPLTLYVYGGLPKGQHPTKPTTTSTAVCGGGPSAVTAGQQQFYLQEMRASNQNTPAASPLRRQI